MGTDTWNNSWCYCLNSHLWLRRLLRPQKGHEEEITKIFEKWDLPAVIIGEVTQGIEVIIYHNNELKARVPAPSLVLGEGAPVYIREAKEPHYLAATRAFDPYSLPPTDNLNEMLLKLLGSTTIASKRWVFDQYDSMVRTNTIVGPGSDSAVIYIKEINKAIQGWAAKMN